MTSLFYLEPFALLFLAGGGALGWFGGAKLRREDVIPIFLLGGPLVLAPLALFLADGNSFSRSALWFWALIWGISGLVQFRRFGGRIPRSIWKQGVLWVGLTAALLFSRPHEYLYGGWDPGEYVCTAQHIERTGGIDYVDALAPNVPFNLRPTLFRNVSNHDTRMHAGYICLNPDSGEMVPDYFHLYPAWLSIFSGGGLETVYLGQWTIAIIAIMLLFSCVQRLMGSLTAALASSILLTNPSILYFGRFPSSEFLSISLIFSLLYLLQREQGTGTLRLIALAALASALSHITNLLPLAGIMVASVGAWILRPTRWGAVRSLALITGTSAGLIRNAIVTPMLTEHLFKVYVLEPLPKIGVLALAAVTLVTLGMFLFRRAGPRFAKGSPSFSCGVRWLPGIVLLGIGLQQYFLRPALSSHKDAINLQSLGWLFSPAGLLLVWGYFFTGAWKRKHMVLAMFLTAGLLSSFVLIHHKNISPLYMWAFRRYLPIVIPFFAILAAECVSSCLRHPRRFHLHWAPAALLVVTLLLQGIKSIPMLRVREYAGLPDALGRVAAPLQDADFILCDHWKNATPLRHGFGLPAYQLSREEQSVRLSAQKDLLRLLQGQVADGQTAYYLSHRDPFYLPGLRCIPLNAYTYRGKRLERRRSALPQGLEDVSGTANLFRLQPIDETTHRESESNIHIALGYHRIGLRDGFHRLRRSSGTSYRWTDGAGELYIPSLSVPADLILHLAHKRPNETPIPVEIRLNGTNIQTLEVGNDWEMYTIPLPPATAATSVLGIHSDRWNPADFDIQGYPADLGIRVASVELRGKMPDASDDALSTDPL